MEQPDFSSMTHEAFEFYLSEVLSNYSAMDLFAMVPDIQSEVMEYFNNQVLDLWAKNQTDQGD